MTDTSSGGGQIARERLIESYLPLVRTVARRHTGRGESLDDLVQIGAIGLIKASGRFDASRGVAFATFAAPAIDGEIRRHLRDRSSSLRIPRGLQRASSELRRQQGELAATLGHSPTLEELAVALDTDEQQLERALKAELAREAVPLSTGGGAEEAPGASDQQGGSEDRLSLAASIRALDERERTIVFLRFHADLTEREIARKLGISQAHVSRLLRDALVRLRSELAKTNDRASNGDTARKNVVSGGAEVTSTLRKPTENALIQTSAQRGPGKVGEVLIPSSEDPTIAHYLDLPYSVAVKLDRDGDDAKWSAVVEELPGCVAHGSTPDEAVDRLRPAMRTWLAAALDEGREIPAPGRQSVKQRSPSGHSGRFLVRMPGPLHEQLVSAAKREQLSLNRFVTNVLAASVSPAVSPEPSPQPSPEPSPEPSPAVASTASPAPTDAAVRPSEHTPEPSPRARREPSPALRLAVATNLIVVVLSGLAAVVLFVLAVLSGL
jgi:RNA polymerase sigma-B factor